MIPSPGAAGAVVPQNRVPDLPLHRDVKHRVVRAHGHQRALVTQTSLPVCESGAEPETRGGETRQKQQTWINEACRWSGRGQKV